MKIIDTHTHLPGNVFGMQSRSGAALEHEFRKDGLAGAWIFTTDGLFDDSELNNSVLAGEIKGMESFFTGFCTVNPRKGESQCLSELYRAKYELGLKGVKLHPWIQSFSMTCPSVTKIIKEAGILKMPVVLHDGSPPFSTPLQIAHVAEKCQEATIVLGHCGLDDLFHDAILACLRNNNIFLCLCSLSTGNISRVVDSCPPDRLLYGSDGGFAPGLINDAILKVSSACSNKDTLSMIFYENPSKIIPVEHNLEPTSQRQRG